MTKKVALTINLFILFCFFSLVGEKNIFGDSTRKRKSGFIDKMGKMVIPPIFDNAYGFSEGLAAVKIDGKWGFIDKTGKIIIEPQFCALNIKYYSRYSHDVIPGFKEGLVGVKVGEKWGYIDKKGKYVLEPQYYEANAFSEGLAPVAITSKYSFMGYINKTGRIVVQPQFYDADIFFEGMSIINIRYSHHDPNIIPCYLNKKTRKLIQIEKPGVGKKIVVLHRFSEGLAAVGIGLDYDKWAEHFWDYGNVDKSGKFVKEPNFDDLDDYFDVYRDDGGYYDPNIGEYVYKIATQLTLDNKKITYPEYDGVTDCFWGYIDKTGKFVIEPQFKHARDFSEGLAAVDGGYINKSGEYVIEFKKKIRHDSFFGSFHEGLANVVSIDRKMFGYGNVGYIDKTGQFVIMPKFYSGRNFSDGVAFVSIDDKTYAIDKEGEIIFDCTFDIGDEMWVDNFSEGLANIIFWFHEDKHTH